MLPPNPTPPLPMSIDASLVASLRSRTGVSILECQKALEEAGGDEEKAIELLRKRGAAQAVKKAAREQSEGLIFIAQEEGKVALVLLRCETDFVARNEDFQALGNELAALALSDGEEAVRNANDKITAAVQQLGENITLGDVNVIEGETLGTYVHTNSKIGVVVSLNGGTTELAKEVAMHTAAMNPSFVTPDDVPADTIEKEKGMWKEQLKKDGKPDEIIEKIILGKEKKFREESALTTQPFVKNPEQTIGQLLGDASVTSYMRMSVA